MENEILLSKYCYFDKEFGKFYATEDASEIMYHKKNIICSYSGINEWVNHFVCEMIDLYSGSSKYNYSLGTTVHEAEIEQIWSVNKDSVINWVSKLTESEWSVDMFKAFDNIIDTLILC